MIIVTPNGNVAQEAAPGESDKGLYKPTFQLTNSMYWKFEETFPDIIKFVETNYRNWIGIGKTDFLYKNIQNTGQSLII